MKVRLLSTLFAAAALWVGGCRMCASPFDCCGPTDLSENWGARRGSIFSDAYKYGSNEVVPDEEVIYGESPTGSPQRPTPAAEPRIQKQTSSGERVTMAGVDSARRRR